MSRLVFGLKLAVLLILGPVAMIWVVSLVPEPQPYGPGTCTFLASCISLSDAFTAVLYLYVPVALTLSIALPLATKITSAWSVAWKTWAGYVLAALGLFGFFAFFWAQ